MRTPRRGLRALLCCVAVGMLLAGCRENAVPETLEEIREAYCADPQWRRFAGISVLTVAKAQEIAEANNPDYNSAGFAVNAARMRYYQAIGAYAPEIKSGFEIGQSILDRDDITNPFPTTVPYTNRFGTAGTLRASWLLFDGLARELGVLARRGEFRIASDERSNVLRILRRAVAYAYYDVLLAGELERIAEANIEFQRSCLAQASVRFNSGFIAKGDWLGFKIDLNKALSDRVRAREQRLVARYALAALMGYPDGDLPDGVRLTPIADLIERPALELEFYLNEALFNRPDLRGMRTAIDVARYRKYSGVSAFFPTINAFGDAGFATRMARYRGYEFNHAYWNNFTYGYGVSADWMIFNGFARYNRYRELCELYQESRLQFAQKQIEVLTEVETAYTVLRSGAEIARLYQEMMNWVFEQRNLVVVEYWAGNVTITRLRGAQNDLVTAEGNLAVALIEMSKADAQLIAAVNGSALLEEVNAPETVPLLDSLFDHLEQKFGE